MQKIQAAMIEQSRTQQQVAPLTGATIQMATLHHDGTLLINPVGTLPSITVALPADIDSDLGEKREVFSTQTITSFTLTGATTIVGAPSSLDPMGHFTIEKILSNTWVVI